MTSGGCVRFWHWWPRHIESAVAGARSFSVASFASGVRVQVKAPQFFRLITGKRRRRSYEVTHP